MKVNVLIFVNDLDIPQQQIRQFVTLVHLDQSS